MRPPNGWSLPSEKVDIWLMAKVMLHIMRTENTCLIPYPPTLYYKETGKTFSLKLFVLRLLDRAFENYDPADPASTEEFVQVFKAGVDVGLIKAKAGIEPVRLRTRVWEMAVDGSSPCPQSQSPLHLPYSQPLTSFGPPKDVGKTIHPPFYRGGYVVFERKPQRTSDGRKV